MIEVFNDGMAHARAFGEDAEPASESLPVELHVHVSSLEMLNAFAKAMERASDLTRRLANPFDFFTVN